MGEIVVLDTSGAVVTTESDRVGNFIRAWLNGYRSKHTRTAYENDLRQFREWCASHDVDPIAVRRFHVDTYARALEEHGATPATVARKLSALASFYGYLAAEEIIERMPLTHVRRPRTDSDSQRTGLDRDEVLALRSIARKDGPRSHALIELLVGNGLRISEALSLDVTDMETERGHRVLHVVRKGGKRTTESLAPPVIDALDTYLDGRTNGPLFITATGRRMHRTYAFRLVGRLAKTAGVAGRKSPHSLRHSFITLSLDAGVPLRDVQDAAGHADPRTTRRYDRARHNLDRHAAYALARHLAE